ncbi:WD40/YVTN/BNR-like repeat-containing protein [Planctomycetota bacterium]
MKQVQENNIIRRGLALLCLCLSLITSIQAQAETLTDTFDDPALPGWEHSQGVHAEDGILYIEPGHFTALSGNWNEFKLVLRLRRFGDGEFVITYCISEGRSYHAVIGNGFSALQYETSGIVTELHNASVAFSLEEWGGLTIQVSENEHTLRVNEKTIWTVTRDERLPTGGIALETLGGLTLHVDEMTLIHEGEAFPPSVGELTWVYTGGPSGGLGYDVRMDPRNPEVMYVTDALAGAFKSIDGGASWFAINNGISARIGPSVDEIPVFSLTVNPNNPDTLWVGTQFGGGVYRSDDGGQNWRSMSNGISEHSLTVRGFTVEPGNSNVVYLAGEVSSWEWKGEHVNGIAFDLTKGVVYKTTDGGQNWKRIWYGDNLARYIWIHPQNHSLVYVSTGIFDREAANSDPNTKDPGGVGILRSDDGGTTWEALGVKNGIRANELHFSSLAMNPRNPEILIGAAGNDAYVWAIGSEIGAIYLTKDGGDSWERVLGLTNATCVEICESDPNIVYGASLDACYRSDDGGKTWQLQAGSGGLEQSNASFWGPPDMVAGFPIDMQCDPRDPMRLFVNNYGGGNFLSADGGQNWVNASKGYTGALMHTITVDRNDPARVYASARSGVFVSKDGGTTWDGMSRGVARAMEAFAIAIDPFDSAHLITVIADAGPVPKNSYDHGQTWSQADPGLWNSGLLIGGDLMRKIIFSPTQQSVVLAIQGDVKCSETGNCTNGQGVIRSKDGGVSWERTGLSEGMATDLVFAQDGSIYVSVHPSDLYRSSDNGDTWEVVTREIAKHVSLVDPDMPSPSLISLAIEPMATGNLYAGFYRGGVMVSTDGGTTWTISSAGLNPETTVRAIEIDTAHPGVMYAATHDSGVYVSTDSGATWQAINNGLINRAGVDLALSSNGQHVYLATHGGGAYRLDLNSQPPVAISEGMRLFSVSGKAIR